MKRFSFILILPIIFTSYLFSQSEENKIIKTDTVLVEETVADTILIEEFISNQKESIGIISVNYLGTIAPLMILRETKSRDIKISPWISYSGKFPVSNQFHIILKFSNFAVKETCYDPYIGNYTNTDNYGFLDIMCGYYFTLDANRKFIGEVSSGLSTYFCNNLPMIAIPISINVYYRIFKHVVISVGIDSYSTVGKDHMWEKGTHLLSPSLGVGFSF